MISANRLDFFLDDSSRVLAEARRTIAIDSILKKTLPEGLSARAGRISEGVLKIHADNPGIAFRLKQISPSLLEKLKAGGIPIHSLKISVAVRNPQKTGRREKKGMGETGLESFRELADSLEDSPLKSSVKHLLSRLDRR